MGIMLNELKLTEVELFSHCYKQNNAIFYANYLYTFPKGMNEDAFTDSCYAMNSYISVYIFCLIVYKTTKNTLYYLL